MCGYVGLSHSSAKTQPETNTEPVYTEPATLDMVILWVSNILTINRYNL